MARDKGQSKFSSNFEVKISEMLDPRLLVDTKEELINKETWPYDGNTIYMKEGMYVYVKGDGFYELVSLANILAEDYSGWKKVTSGDEGGSDVYFSDLLSYSDIMYTLTLGQTLDVSIDIVRDFIEKAKGKLVVFSSEDGTIVANNLTIDDYGEDVLCRFDFCGINDDDIGIVKRIEYDSQNERFFLDVVGLRQDEIQPILVSGTNIKTINGMSVLGSGDLITAYPIINPLKQTSSTGYTYNIEANKCAKIDTITANTTFKYYNNPSIPSILGGNVEEYLIEFPYTSGSISFPSSVKWQNETVPTFKSGYTYQISIVNNLACFAEFKTA